MTADFSAYFNNFFPNSDWLAQPNFPIFNLKALALPVLGAAGYEYCGLMMNVANIVELQYRPTSWLAGNIVSTQ